MKLDIVHTYSMYYVLIVSGRLQAEVHNKIAECIGYMKEAPQMFGNRIDIYMILLRPAFR